jgi:hypothetical protein
MAVTMKNGVFWVVTPSRATRRNNPEDTILQRKLFENKFTVIYILYKHRDYPLCRLLSICRGLQH